RGLFEADNRYFCVRNHRARGVGYCDKESPAWSLRKSGHRRGQQSEDENQAQQSHGHSVLDAAEGMLACYYARDSQEVAPPYHGARSEERRVGKELMSGAS